MADICDTRGFVLPFSRPFEMAAEVEFLCVGKQKPRNSSFSLIRLRLRESFSTSELSSFVFLRLRSAAQLQEGEKSQISIRPSDFGHRLKLI